MASRIIPTLMENYYQKGIESIKERAKISITSIFTKCFKEIKNLCKIKVIDKMSLLKRYRIFYFSINYLFS